MSLEVPLSDQPEAVAKLESLLSVLIPGRITIVDGLGNTYEVSTSFTAAKQYRFNKLLKDKLSEHPGLVGILSAGSTDMKAVIGVLVSASTDPQVIQALSDAFALLHPDVLAKAKESAESIVPADVEAVGLAGALFGTEELVKAIVPFVLRQVRGLIESMLPVVKAAAGMSSSTPK
jgi:hypothetical protein